MLWRWRTIDRNRRNKLRRVVNKCKKLLEAEIARRLRFYGIEEDGTFLAQHKLPHLTGENLEIRKKIEEAIEKEKAGGLTIERAVRRYIHHVSFTYLNRLAALRAMEVRKLITETIIRRPEYGGRSLRERQIVESNPGLAPDQALKECLLEAFGEISHEIKVLFDPENEYSLVFPETTTLRGVIQLLTEEVTEQDWKEDDIIGWIYQYFNEEARQQYRKAKKKPTPDDIPIISQFYTPHWIVKALTDNTLGRLWLQMNPDSKVKEFCTYLIPIESEQDKTVVKRARDIKVLDPACGSGHFLVYAFDVLYLMYQEDEPDTPISEIPALILENNIFGIDIDLRAVQLAALSLYLKAKTYNLSLKFKKMNLVCADVRISDGEKRIQFLQRFKDDPDLERIFSKLFEDLGYTYEIGSLLKVRHPFERLFKERRPGEKQARFAYTISGQTQLRKKGLVGQTKFLVEPSEGSGVNLTVVVPKERTIEKMIEELREFEREAIEAQDIGKLLFATEAEKSVGLLALLSERYDVVLMNPPHGVMPSKTKEYSRQYYPRTHHDYYAAFVEQAIDLTEPLGFVGVLTGRALLITKSFQKMREEIFQKDALPQIFLDLGFKTMEEAHARYAAFTLNRVFERGSIDPQSHKITFFSLARFEWDDKRLAFEKCLKAYPSSENVYEVTIGELSEVPGTPYAYWAPRILRKLFSKFPPLDRDVAKKPGAPKIADVKQGLATADKVRFTRFWWEIYTNQIATSRQETFEGKKWVPFADEFYLFYFYADIPVVLNWMMDGEEIRNFPNAVIRNERFYFKPGIAWSANLQRTQLETLWRIQRIPFRAFPEGAIFGVGAQGVIVDFKKAWSLLAICCSRLIFAVSRLLASENKQGTATTASLPIAFQPEAFDTNASVLPSLAKEAHDLLREWSTGEEVSTLFIKPWLLQTLYGFKQSERPVTKHPLTQQFEWSDWQSAQKIRSIKGSPEMSLKELSELCVRRQHMLNERIEEIQKEIDEEVYRIYGISDEDRALIEHELALQRGLSSEDEKSIEMEATDDEKALINVISADEYVKRLISYYAKKAIESDKDGIVPLQEMFPDNLATQVRQQIIADFGKANLDRIEKELEKILGKTLPDWLAEDFFDFHVTLYRRRPIFWQLTSEHFGSGRSRQYAFSCFLYYRKVTKDSLRRIQALYLNKVREHILMEKDYISHELVSASEDRKKELGLRQQYAQISEKLDELEKFNTVLTELHKPRRIKTKLSKDSKWMDQKIAEVRDEGWNPILDYGVRVNIEPLKDMGLLSHAAEKVR